MEMEERARQLLAEMQGELAKGQQMMAELEQRQLNLRDTMLQIRGAITALEMLLNQQSGTVSAATVGAAPAVTATTDGVEEQAVVG